MKFRLAMAAALALVLLLFCLFSMLYQEDYAAFGALPLDTIANTDAEQAELLLWQ